MTNTAAETAERTRAAWVLQQSSGRRYLHEMSETAPSFSAAALSACPRLGFRRSVSPLPAETPDPAESVSFEAELGRKYGWR